MIPVQMRTLNQLLRVKKGGNQILSDQQQQPTTAPALSDATYCHKSLSKLVAESQHPMSTSTLRRVFATDGNTGVHPPPYNT